MQVKTTLKAGLGPFGRSSATSRSSWTTRRRLRWIWPICGGAEHSWAPAKKCRRWASRRIACGCPASTTFAGWRQLFLPVATHS